MAWNPDYTTAARLKSYLRIPGDDSADDVLLGVWITTVSANINSHCRRQFGKVTGSETRRYVGEYDKALCRFVYQVDDIYDTGGLAVADDAGNAVTGFTFEPSNAITRGRPVTRLITDQGNVGPLDLTTGKFGWSAVPPSIESAIWLFAARLAARRDSPFGIAGSPSEGSELRLLAKLDPDMITVLKPFRRYRAAA